MVMRTRSRYDGGQNGSAVAMKGRIEAAKSRYSLPPTFFLPKIDLLIVLQAGRTNPLE
jgi:hypothetical protein